jgi:UDP-N-acetylglucosamine 2-epimerase
VDGIWYALTQSAVFMAMASGLGFMLGRSGKEPEEDPALEHERRVAMEQTRQQLIIDLRQMEDLKIEIRDVAQEAVRLATEQVDQAMSNIAKCEQAGVTIDKTIEALTQKLARLEDTN